MSIVSNTPFMLAIVAGAGVVAGLGLVIASSIGHTLGPIKKKVSESGPLSSESVSVDEDGVITTPVKTHKASNTGLPKQADSSFQKETASPANPKVVPITKKSGSSGKAKDIAVSSAMAEMGGFIVPDATTMAELREVSAQARVDEEPKSRPEPPVLTDEIDEQDLRDARFAARDEQQNDQSYNFPASFGLG